MTLQTPFVYLCLVRGWPGLFLSLESAAESLEDGAVGRMGVAKAVQGGQSLGDLLGRGAAGAVAHGGQS